VVAIVVDRMAAHMIPARFIDPLSFVTAATMLAGVALSAMAAPAHRAAGTDPMRTLRQD